MNKIDILEGQLNDPCLENRLEALKVLSNMIKKPDRGSDVNSHIHTTYSFSPYSPTKALYMACISGLATAGIMDHDSVAGTREFIQAGEILGMLTTIGVECRVSMKKTFLKNTRINNPDQDGVIYCALHGIPHSSINIVSDYFKPYIEKRVERNKKMVANINDLIAAPELLLDYDADVIPISMYHDGGTVTERHLMFALVHKFINRFGKGLKLLEFMRNILKLDISSKQEELLIDISNPHYEYDLLGVLKSELIPLVYVDADDECPDVTDYISLAKATGAISAYAYLGDVTNSVTGDKKAQKFEDDYIDELFLLLKELGFDAVTYMPSRNTLNQVRRVKDLCKRYEFFQISGEDINQPRQKFVCEAMRDQEFENLIIAAYALIGHEKEATVDIKRGMFSEDTIKNMPHLEDRIKYFANKAI
jgi:hypothetical protein